jgi:hypothetical protein
MNLAGADSADAGAFFIGCGQWYGAAGLTRWFRLCRTYPGALRGARPVRDGRKPVDHDVCRYAVGTKEGLNMKENVETNAREAHIKKIEADTRAEREKAKDRSGIDHEVEQELQTVRPGSDAPSRAGITPDGSGADGERG